MPALRQALRRALKPALLPGGATSARIRWLGAGVALLLAALALAGSPWQRRVQLAWFDAYQAAMPRKVPSFDVTVVAIDAKSLAEIGQWPWPRSDTARLIDGISAHRPAAIGIDLLWREPDRMSPEAIARSLPAADAQTRARLLALPSNDSLLAGAIGRAPVVLAVAGAPEPTGEALRAPPFRLFGAEAVTSLAAYQGGWTSLPAIDRAAAGRGLISADLEHAVVRRMPLVASVAGTPVPGLTLEMLRVATRSAALSMYVEGGSLRRVAAGAFAAPVEADGAAWLHFSPSYANRYVSAADVIAGRVPAVMLQDRLVLIGITGLGLVDYQTVASGERMPGVEVHAQLLEMMLHGSMLVRPRWAVALEWIGLAAGSALLIWLVPALTPRRSLAAAAALLGLTLAAGWGMFYFAQALFDAATLALNLAGVSAALLAASLVEARRRERWLELQVEQQRQEAARVAAEFEAARRIQTGILPRPEALPPDPRFEIAAQMTPAREVGGDLYDFFMLDRDRLFFLIGDVSGKGLPASIFMAVAKALYKSNVLRAGDAHSDAALTGVLMTAANAEVARENSESMFVTLFAGILDLNSGALSYCNAGHDNPAVIAAGGGLTHLTGGGGPPLCVLDDFQYEGASAQLARGDVICMVTDGITEAQNRDAALYGTARLQAAQRAAQQAAQQAAQHAAQQSPGSQVGGAASMLGAVHADATRFMDGAELADDLTILVLRWNGTPTATAAPGTVTP